MGNRIKTGLASFGMSGRVFHAPLLKANESFEFSAVCERAKNEAAGIYPGVKVYRTYDDLLNDDEIELIVVNTPDHLHFPMAKNALMRGKHVIVEKPFTQQYEEAAELIGLAGKRNLLLSVFQNRRWDGDFLTVKKIISGNMLGRLVEFESHFDRYRNYIVQDNWKEKSINGTGILYNLGSHMIDQVIVLFGKPLSVCANIGTFREGGEIDDNYELMFEYPGIKVTTKGSMLVKEPGPRYILHGTEGSFLKWGSDPQENSLKEGALPGSEGWGQESESDWGLLNTIIDGNSFRGKYKTEAGNYNAFYDSILNSIRHGAEPDVKAEDAAFVIRIINEAFRSSKEGKKISLSW